MSTSNESYKIPLKSLSVGKHEYSFHITDSFFRKDENSEIEGGNIDVKVRVKKSEYSSDISLSLEGMVTVLCDRCLTGLEIPVETTDEFVVKEGLEFSEEENNIIVIPEREDDFDISWLLYELIVLSLPMKKVHEEEDCNVEMINSLEKYAASDSKEEQTSTDPRWDGLRKLLDNNNN